MRMLGLIGGMSWESSAHYYRLINEGMRDALGPTASARCLLWSFDFSEIAALQHAGDWARLETLLVDAGRRLVGAGAERLLICTNTMHLLADAVEAAAGVPLLHIADPTGEAIRAAGLHSVALLGTAFTMERPFYRMRLTDRHGIEVIVPDEAGRELVHRVIYDELVAGIVRDESRRAIQPIIAGLVESGAQGVVLGCTELMMLIGQADCGVPVFDTTAIHARAAVQAALA